ncbi:tetratricopeptide repeat protein [Janthinobacterium sp. UMAB-60]|uniref:tetratricopeptide repeat protein n=1 Tax=Janthinobacterium sp. UMAB-60 TaxID=1365365 RepID=UPI001C588EDA|nr:tetratricopeptide repeat protein [Janthinobacterium sp. UMAB-60]
MHATDNTASPQNAAQQPMQLEIDHVTQLYENGEHAQMESATRALLERYPASAFAWSVLSMALQLQGKDALPALHKTVDLAPDDAEAHLHLGNAQLAIGQLDLAVGSYVRALEIQPAFTEAFSRLGDALQAQGHLPEAADCYREVLKMDPAHAVAHMGLGDILQLQRQFKAAETSYRHALTLAPGAAEIHRAIGDVQLAMGQHEQAILSYERALASDPDCALAHGGLADVLYKLGRYQQAAARYGAAVQYLPHVAAHYHGWGRSLHAIGQAADAEAAYRRAIELAPSVVAPLLHYADLLRETRRTEQAIVIYQAVFLLEPKNTDALHNLGVALQENGKLDQALAAFQQLLALMPNNPIAHCNIGVVMQALGQRSIAMQSYRRALEMNPRHAAIHFNLGTCQMESGQMDEAAKSYATSIKLDPQAYQSHLNLNGTLNRLGRINEAIAHCRQVLKSNPDWDELHSNLLFYLSHSEHVDAAALFAEHLRFGERFEAPLRAAWPPHENTRDPERRLRIGLVSADLYNHAVANFITPVLQQLAHAPRLEIVVYANSKHDDAVTRHLQGLVSVWRQVELLSHEELAQQITSDAIDILIDLSGHTGYSRLLTFARKPAPLQASWIGYPLTTGLQAMDYYLTDRHMAPPGLLDKQFTEKLVFLPASAPFIPSPDAPPVSPAPACEHGHITFGSFNRANKLSRSVIARWSALLLAVPNARMVLAGMPSEDSSNKLRAWFAKEGIAAERLSFYAHTNTSDYLALHRLVDVCLDTLPYTGGTTTLHALWMGVPTLTMKGSILPSLVSATILEHVGLNAFIAQDDADFVQKGRLIATDIAQLAALRAGLRARVKNSAMGQPALIAAGLENALRTMWQRWCAGLPPASFEAEFAPVSKKTEDVGL